MLVETLHGTYSISILFKVVLCDNFIFNNYCHYLTLEYVKRAKLLVAHGASINLQDKGGWTVVHQCAWFGYFPLLEYFILKGGDITMVTNNSQNSLDLALIRGHTQIVDYLDLQSGNLKQHCRRTIRKSLGFKCDTKIQHLILPSSLKLFLNYGNPYPGWLGPAAVIQPWPLADVRSGKVLQKDVQDFLQENASEDFLKEQTVNKQNMSQDELANLIERLYFWEEFKQVTYEEPPSRPPRYSMEAIAPRPPLVPDH